MTPERRDWWCTQVLNENGPLDRRRIVEAIAREARREALEAAAAEFPDDGRYYKNVGAFLRALQEPT